LKIAEEGFSAHGENKEKQNNEQILNQGSRVDD